MLILSCLAVAFFPVSGEAAIVGIDGDILQIPAPLSVVTGELENDDRAILFQEKENFLLAQDLIVDAALPGSYGPEADLSMYPQGVVPAGTWVTSYYLHIDPVTPGTQYAGSIVFDSSVLGIAFWHTLASTGSQLGLTETAYSSSGVNVNLKDQIIWTTDNDLHEISLNIRTDKYADNFRVLVQGSAPVPLPPSLYILSSGLIALVGIRRKKRL